MKGLELAKKFYNECGKKMLEEKFPETIPYIAVGLFGSGSECLGYDDEASQDHDFEPGFCIFLPSEEIVDRKTAFELERAYAKLPNEFLGYKRSRLSPVGGNRHGVIRTADFFTDHIGSATGELSAYDFLTIPENYLIECTNGEIFDDFYGEVTKIRNNLAIFPEDIRLKKLAGYLLLCGQSGEYNYERIFNRGDYAGAQLSICEFVKSAIHVFMLINHAYTPYYKWQFKALEAYPDGDFIAKQFEYLISTPSGPDFFQEKQEIVENIFQYFLSKLNLNKKATSFEEAAYIVNDLIANNEIRNANVLSGV